MSSSTVSCVNGAPLVSRAQESRPPLVRYAPCGGLSKARPLQTDGGRGSQYLVKMCSRQALSYVRHIRQREEKRSSVIDKYLF